MLASFSEGDITVPSDEAIVYSLEAGGVGTIAYFRSCGDVASEVISVTWSPRNESTVEISRGDEDDGVDYILERTEGCEERPVYRADDIAVFETFALTRVLNSGEQTGRLMGGRLCLVEDPPSDEMDHGVPACHAEFCEPGPACEIAEW
ncbi:MAG: hypothetical protein ACE37F_01625 [Nannocystaceae bacterium]|nr:hypothetical protein [bacterium]